LLKKQIAQVLDLNTADPVWVALLDQADAVYARIERLEKATPRSMTTTGSKGQEVLHPFVQEVRQQRLALARILRELGLKDDLPASNGQRPGAALAARRWKR
jgi:hypothetical protein